MTDVLIQTRLPRQIGQWVDRQAKAAGLSVAAWLRFHLVQEAKKMFVEAWLVSKTDAYKGPPHRAQYLLEQARTISGTERAFWLLKGASEEDEAGMPVSPGEWGRVRDLREIEMGLKGSNQPWTIIGTMYDETSQRIEITLRAS